MLSAAEKELHSLEQDIIAVIHDTGVDRARCPNSCYYGWAAIYNSEWHACLYAIYSGFKFCGLLHIQSGL